MLVSALRLRTRLNKQFSPRSLLHIRRTPCPAPADRPVYPDGTVCISILHTPGDDPTMYEQASERWSPVQSVEKVILSVISMLAGACARRPFSRCACLTGWWLPPVRAASSRPQKLTPFSPARSCLVPWVFAGTYLPSLFPRGRHSGRCPPIHPSMPASLHSDMQSRTWRAARTSTAVSSTVTTER